MKLDGIDLEDMQVLDAWTPGVEAVVARTLSGRQVVWRRPAPGAPLDLVGRGVWLRRWVLDALRALAETPGPFELETGQHVRMVRFRLEDAPVIEAEPVEPDADPHPDDPMHRIIIRLHEV